MNAAILRAPGAVRVPAARTGRVSKSSPARVGTATCRQAKPALSMGFAPLAASRKRGSVATNTRAIALTDVLRPGAQADRRVRAAPEGDPRPGHGLDRSLGGKCTVGDVASAAGVKLSDAENAMKAIAADTGATLEVSAQGDILYVFDRDFRSLLNAKSTKIKTVEPLVEGAARLEGTS